jgi:hypothetical protein
MEKIEKCEHAGCNCKPASGKAHCSEACADPKINAGTICQCRHPECNWVGLKM